MTGIHFDDMITSRTTGYCRCASQSQAGYHRLVHTQGQRQDRPDDDRGSFQKCSRQREHDQIESRDSRPRGQDQGSTGVCESIFRLKARIDLDYCISKINRAMIAGVAGLGMTIFGAVLCCFCPPAIGLFAVSPIKMVEGFTYWIAED
jgi:hypothetical protein